MTRAPLSVGANAKTRFDNGFRIDEERLRRIASIVQDSIGSDPAPEVRFKIYRSDGLTYETLDIADIAAEGNFASERIEKLSVHANTDEIDATVELYDGETRLDIEGKDRNTVQVLNSTLRSFLRDDVCNRRTVPKRMDRVILFAFIAIMPFFIVVTLLSDASNEGALREAVESNDLAQKLNYLLESRTRSASMALLLLIFLLLLLIPMGFTLFGGRLVDHFFPKSIFLFGKEIERIEKLIALRSKLAWAIGVGFPVSFFAGLIVWLLTR